MKNNNGFELILPSRKPPHPISPRPDPIVVLRTSTTGVRALSRNCTHAGFTVNINSAANNLVCPSHNSIFDLNGNVVSGPASGALTRYSASLSGSIITISQGS